MGGDSGTMGRVRLFRRPPTPSDATASALARRRQRPAATITTLPERPARAVTPAMPALTSMKLIRQLRVSFLLVVVPSIAAPVIALLLRDLPYAANVAQLAGVALGAFAALLAVLQVILTLLLSQLVSDTVGNQPSRRQRREVRREERAQHRYALRVERRALRSRERQLRESQRAQRRAVRRARPTTGLRLLGQTLVCISFVAFALAFQTSGLLAAAWHLIP